MAIKTICVYVLLCVDHLEVYSVDAAVLLLSVIHINDITRVSLHFHMFHDHQ